MNKLELVQELVSQTGSIPVADVTASTLASPSVKLDKIIRYIDRAYNEIQIDQDYWSWMIKDGGVLNTVGGTRYYDVSASIPDYDEIVPFTSYRSRRYIWLKESSGDNYPESIIFEPFDRFAGLFDRQTEQGKPLNYSIRSNDGFVGFWPIPSREFRIEFRYRRLPDEMTTATDVPIFPARYHMAIVYWALVHYGVYSEAPEKLARAKEQLTNIYQKLLNNSLPDLRMLGA